MNWRFSQRFARCFWQKKHSLHGPELALTTRIPAEKLSTPSPTSSTTPASSWPKTAGGTIMRAWNPWR